MKNHHFPVTRMARYTASGDVSAETCELMVALHGYGQLAPDFAADLTSTQDLLVPGRVLVCPEGLSRYYTNHRERTVGASWMTREEREYEILDHVAWLDALLEHLLEEAPDHLRLRVLGFSQGAPTASRWVANGAVQPDQLILWAAPAADDLSDEEWALLADVPEIVVVAGSDDALFPPDRVDRAMATLSGHGCAARLVTFEGGHRMDPDVLASLIDPS
ncbi:MAG: esterase [Rhodothermales bacterium]